MSQAKMDTYQAAGLIDPRAAVDPGAQIGEGVSIGPFSIVENDVRIGDRTRIGPFVTVRAHTQIGCDNEIYQYSSIGEAPQFLGYKGEPTRLIIGDGNVIREYCTLNRGTVGGRTETVIGDHNFLMAYVHIAHDCRIGNRTIFANCASLGGHVDVGDFAILGGFTLVHQFCRVGAHSITGIGSVCLQDVPPYMVAAGNTAKPHGVNVKGLRRREFSDDDVACLRRAYRCLYRSQLDLRSAIGRLSEEYADNFHVTALIAFLQSSERGIIR